MSLGLGLNLYKTKATGASGSGAYSNTKSLEFDGVDDRVDFGITNAGTNDVSFSFWMKTTMVVASFGSATAFGGRATVNGDTYTLGRLSSIISSSTILRVRCFNTFGTTQINDGNWHHIAFTHNYTTKETKAYVDGGLEVTVTFPAQANAFFVAQGWNGFNAAYQYSGNVDEPVYFQRVLSPTQITDIYNSGVPTDLSDFSPYGWSRNGDNGSWKSPQWLLPNNENKDKVSNYSFDLDGIDDYIDLGNDSSLDIFGSDFTISLWAKWGNQTSNSNGLINFAANTNKAVITLGFSSQYGKISFGTGSSSTIGILYNCGSGYNDNNWHHVMCTLQGSTRTVYVDGVDISSTGSGSNISVGSNNDIGNRARSRYFVGNIDEVSIFDSVIPIGDLWDGSGEPTTLPSGAVAHYKMGKEATFSGGVWTVPDAIGSNDGTSNGMTIEDRVGNAPNSENNALSFNMDEVDRVEDTP